MAFAVMLLVLSCGPHTPGDPNPTPISTPYPTPYPTPVDLTVEQIIRDYESNPFLAQDRYDGVFATVRGIVYGFDEIQGGYLVIMETGEADSDNFIVCITESRSDADAGYVGGPVAVYGGIRGNWADELIVDGCLPSSRLNTVTVQSWIIRKENEQPYSHDLDEACAILRQAGFEIADDKMWTNEEELAISRVINARETYGSDMLMTALSAIIKVEGENANSWCTARH